MVESLTIIAVSVTILSLVFLFLYLRKAQEFGDIKVRLEYLQKGTSSEDLEKARENFFAMIVHEMRSPLAVIRGSSDLILKEVNNLSQEQIAELLKQIQDSSTQALDLVNDLLDVSKMENGRFEIFASKHSYHKAILPEIQGFEVLALEHGLKLERHFEEDDIVFNFDEDKIRQVVGNLLSNAIKFTPKGGKILVSTSRQGKYLHTVVADTGTGIPDYIKSKIFHKYVQGKENSVSHEKGTGLGLVISKGIVEAHGGTIWVEDNMPHGSRFIFTLPLS